MRRPKTRDRTRDWQVLVVAKAPVAGQAKTRLGVDLGHHAAADLAAASLLDTLAAASEAVGPDRCVLALAGDLADAARGEEVRHALAGWQVVPQRGDGFAERLVAAHADAGRGPVVQVGMDTPQLTAPMLASVAAGLADHDAVVGPATDGGWWALALRDPRDAAALRGVPMSTPATGGATRTALAERGLLVGTTVALTDVDTVADAALVAGLAPGSRFATAWQHHHSLAGR